MLFRGRLRFKLTALVVSMVLIPLFTVMSITIYYLRSLETSNAYNIEKNIAKAASKEIAGFVEVQFGVLENLATIYPGLTEDKEKADLLERILFKNSNFTDISIVDSLGREKQRKNILQVIGKDDLTDRSLTPEFKSVQDYGYYFGPSYLVEGRPFFLIGRRISGLDDSFQGAVFAIVDARAMQSIIMQVSSVPEEGRVYVVDGKGVVVAHPDISQVLDQRDFSQTPSVKFLVLKDTKIDPTQIYTNELKKDVLGAGDEIILSLGDKFDKKLDTSWIVIAEEPASLALAFVFSITEFTVVTLFLIFLISIVVTLIFTHRIVKPIEQLHEASKEFGLGYLDYRLNIHTNDEIEDLAGGFNSMAESLKTSINTLRQDRELIAAERNKLAITLSGIKDGVIALDTDRNIMTFNKASEELTGYNFSEVQSKRIGEVLKLYDLNGEIHELAYCPVTTEGFEGITYNSQDIKIVGKNNKTAVVSLISGQIKEGASVNLGCIITLHDVTKERELEKMKLDFVSMAAHELRTPLTSIRNYLWAIMHKYKHIFEGEALTYINRIDISTQQLYSLVENLLNVSGIERGAIAVNLESVDWPGYVKKIVEEMSAAAREKQISLTYIEPLTKLPSVKADRLRIREVVANLLSNAINFTEMGGKINVWLEQKEEEVVTHILDTGKGIPQEDIPNLFTKFFRITGRLQMGSKGTGLGLYISKSIVQLHGGKIWVDSTVGKGSVFSFSLPVYQ